MAVSPISPGREREMDAPSAPNAELEAINRTTSGLPSVAHTSVSQSKRRPVIIVALVIALLALTGAILHRLSSGPRPTLDLAPQSALVYVEIRDLRVVVNGLESTRAWQTLSPLLASQRDRDDSLWATLDLGFGESLLAAGPRVAVVMTGFELDEDKFTPHLAIIVSTTSRREVLSSLAKDKLMLLAQRAYGEFLSETEEYRGIQVTQYRLAGGARKILWASFDGVLVIANRDDSLRAVIDTHHGRRPSLATSPRLAKLQQVVDRSGEAEDERSIFGLVGSEAVRDLLARWDGAPSATVGGPRLAQELLKTGLSALSFTLAFSVSFEDGEVVDRYLLGLDEQMYDLFSPSVNSQAEFKTLALIPRQSRGFTVYRFANLAETARALDQFISTRFSAVTSIAVRELLARMRSSFGLAASDTVSDAIGNEIAVVDTGGDALLFVLAVSNKPKLAALVGKRLGRSGAKPIEQGYREGRLFSSSKNPSEAYCFLDDYLLIGSHDQIKLIIESRTSGKTVDRDQALVAHIRRHSSDGFETAVSFDRGEVAETLSVVSRWLKLSDGVAQSLASEEFNRKLNELPPSMRTTQIRREGFYSESRSPLGLFSMLLSMFEASES
jgi:hypothetical protein